MDATLPTGTAATAAGDALRNAVKIRSQTMTPAEVARLSAEDPRHHEGYKFVYDNPGRVLPAAEVQVLATAIWVSARKMLEENPFMSDADVGTRIRAESPGTEHFAARSHPKLFEMLVRRHSTKATFDNLMTMIHTKHAIEMGAVDEDDAIPALQQHILKQCLKK
jgi:hypothetical protein